MRQLCTFRLLFFLFFLPLTSAWSQANEFVIFSDRPKSSFQAILLDFEKQFGISTQYVEASSEQLIEQLEKGQRADVVIVKDLYYVAQLIKKDLIMEDAFSRELVQLTPKSTQDAKRRWLPITYRVRALAYSTQLSPSELAGLEQYTDLLHEEWQKALCLRKSQHPYNQTLGAHWIADWGYAATLQFVKTLVGQLALPPLVDDKAILAAIVNGDCLLGLVNHYYVVQWLRQYPHLPIAFKFLKDSTGGTPLNGVNMLLPKTAINKVAATQWAHFLYSHSYNFDSAKMTGELPAILSEQLDYIPASWGQIIPSSLRWEDVLMQFQHVSPLFEQAGYK